jgi:TetR/AcrR family transcriptional regulator, cholesterol catabolism regulator
MNKVKESIMTEALDIYKAKGVKNVTMDIMAAEMGRSKKTLYKYFKNKADLIKKSTAFLINTQKENLDQIHTNSSNAVDEMGQLYLYNIKTFQFMDRRGVSDIINYYPETWEIYLDYKFNYYFSLISDNLKRGKREGFYRRDMNEDIIAKYYISNLDEVTNESIFPQKSFSFKELMFEVFKYHMNGIASEKGLEEIEIIKRKYFSK